jgi:hypothetical protein
MNVLTAIDGLLILIGQVSKVSAMIAQARSEGRDELTVAEMDLLSTESGVALDGLRAAIDAKKAGG